MLFNSYAFLWFLPFSLLFYWALYRYLRLQNVVLVVLSYLFYAWWDFRFLALISIITLLGYVCGLAIEVARSHNHSGKTACTLCVVLCLLILGAFKYYDFFVESLNTLFMSVGIHFLFPLWKVVLPVGISFYTFQVLSYAIDVYHHKISACRDWISFAAFVSFFPQLVAGPIERATHLLPQIQQPRLVAYVDVVDGLRLILWGFVKKMWIADSCAPIVNEIYANPSSDGTDLWMGTILFAFQIYGDFSGYSDIAIGVSRLFGIKLMRNFNLPYFARNVSDFWRRWHISLMSWFRDYIYIPLGGSRCGSCRALLNTFVVFMVSGLWHGANWTFVFWGFYHSLCFVPIVLSPRLKSYCNLMEDKNVPNLLPSIKELVQMSVTFLIICIGWVFFRSPDLTVAFDNLNKMFTDIRLHTPYGGLSSLYPILFLVSFEWIMRGQAHTLDFKGNGILRYRAVRWSLYYFLIWGVLYWGGQQSVFIYFQF